MPKTPERADVARQLRDDRLGDLRLIQRAVNQNHEPARIAALANGLDISPEQTIKVCAAIDAATTPPRQRPLHPTRRLDCTHETICERCGFFNTGPEFAPVPLRQREPATEHHQPDRAELFTRLLDGIDTGP